MTLGRIASTVVKGVPPLRARGPLKPGLAEDTSYSFTAASSPDASRDDAEDRVTARPPRSPSAPPPSTLARPSALPPERTASRSKDDKRPLSGANAKGINFTTMVAAVEKIYGATAVERLRAATPGAVGNALRYGGLVVGGWYPIEWYQDLWSTLQRELDLDDGAARSLGQCAAEIGVNRVYRMFSRLASPAMLLRVAGSAFGSYFDTGSIKVRTRGTNALVAEWSGCTGFNSLLWSDSLGGAAYFLGATGVSNVKVTVLGGGRDENWLIAEGTWR